MDCEDTIYGRKGTSAASRLVSYLSAQEPEIDQSQTTSGSGQVQIISDWFAAIRQNDVMKVNELQSRGYDVNCVDQFGWTGLHYASWNAFDSLVDLLLTLGADPHLPGPGRISPLALASQQGHVTIVDRLIRAGSDVTTTADIDDSRGVTPLHLATQRGHEEVVRSLVRAGAAVNATMEVRGVRGVTPLHLAVENELLGLIDILIETGCDVNRSTQAVDSV